MLGRRTARRSPRSPRTTQTCWPSCRTSVTRPRTSCQSDSVMSRGSTGFKLGSPSDPSAPSPPSATGFRPPDATPLAHSWSTTPKVRDIVGLYMAPPDRALVLCVDEKSQIQALDRTQPLLPLRSGMPARQTHDYKRHGTTTLFAALSMLDGKVIGDCMPRHRHQEFIRFLKQIDTDAPIGLDLHLIVDHYGTHQHPASRRG